METLLLIYEFVYNLQYWRKKFPS